MAAKVRLGHIAVPVQNPQVVSAFYRDFLGLTVTTEGILPPMGAFTFLSDRPETTAQTVAFMTRPEARHIAWEVESLATLRELYVESQERGIRIDFALNHRVSLSLYLRDPEGNSVEIYWLTGHNPEGMYADPFDPALLCQPDAMLLALVGADTPA
ncbi:MAG TPA: VOC family protein [Thermomicrobiales bacterium]